MSTEFGWMAVIPQPEIRREMLILGDHSIDAYLGARTWRCEMKNGFARLSSVYQDDVVWLPDAVVEAECRCDSWSQRKVRYYSPAEKRSMHATYEPSEFHKTCGLYAWRVGIRPNDPRAIAWSSSRLFIHGEVHLWGDVHIHEIGYRAQYARPSAFYVWEGMAGDVRLMTEIAAKQFLLPLIQMDTTCDHESFVRHNWVTGIRTCACGHRQEAAPPTRRARR